MRARLAVVGIAVLSSGCAAKIGAVLGAIGVGVKVVNSLPDVPKPPCLDGLVWSDEAKACVAPSPTPTPTVAPNPSETPNSSCSLPPGSGEGVDCPRTAPKHLGDVDAAIERAIAAHPDWFVDGGRIVAAGFENSFREAVVEQLRAAGACAFFDGEEIALKRTNDYSEQYHILSSANHVRRGEGSYRATCTPAWEAIPSAGPARAPLLVLWRVGDKCSNPKEGPKYQQGLCHVDSTPWYRDAARPNDTKKDGPCSPDHAESWNTFCGRQTWNDSRGGNVTVTGAEEYWKDVENPFFTWVKFSGPFLICARPYPDVNFGGIPVPVLHTAEQCKQVAP